ncbi:hypothetical protein, partial [Hymenobacter glacialis]|uniref:hypothetical protein n=1 Tax=Hymenobacter glacialis TaxID=1908236 RepID=UPI00114CBBD2
MFNTFATPLTSAVPEGSPSTSNAGVAIAAADEDADAMPPGNYDPTLDLARFRFPNLELLNDYGQQNAKKEMVSIRSVLGSEKFARTEMDLPIAFGRTITNEVFVADLAKMPH